MFYSHDLLCRRKNGKFSLIWLAATSRKKLNKISCLKVNISNTCEEITTFISGQPRSDGKIPRLRFSLYLSSLLIHGTCLVYRQQVDIFLSDLVIIHQNLRQVHLTEDGLLVHASLKDRHSRSDYDDSDWEREGKSRPKKAKKTKPKRITELPVVSVDDQAVVPVPVFPEAPGKPEHGHMLHLLSEVDRAPEVEPDMYNELTLGLSQQMPNMDINDMEKMDALLEEMNATLLEQQHDQIGATLVAEPMEVDVQPELRPPQQEQEVCKDKDDNGVMPQQVQESSAAVQPEKPAAVDTVTQPDVELGTEKEGQAVQPPTTQPASAKKAKRKATMPPPAEVPAVKRKRVQRILIDHKTTIDAEHFKRMINDRVALGKAMRIQSWLEDLPDFYRISMKMHPEELLETPAMEILNPTLKKNFSFKIFMREMASQPINTSAPDRSRAGSDVSKTSLDRSRSQLARVDEELPVSVTLVEEELPKTVPIDERSSGLVQQLDITPGLETSALVPEVALDDIVVAPEMASDVPVAVPTVSQLGVQQRAVEAPLPEEMLFEENELQMIPPEYLNQDGAVLKKKQDQLNATQESSEGSAGSSQTPSSQQERVLLLSLEHHWQHNRVLTFQMICPPQSNTKKKAAKMFSLLLRLKKDLKIDLQQKEPFRFGDIEILPPVRNHSSSLGSLSSQ